MLTANQLLFLPFLPKFSSSYSAKPFPQEPLDICMATQPSGPKVPMWSTHLVTFHNQFTMQVLHQLEKLQILIHNICKTVEIYNAANKVITIPMYDRFL